MLYNAMILLQPYQYVANQYEKKNEGVYPFQFQFIPNPLQKRLYQSISLTHATDASDMRLVLSSPTTP
jgi:hypothetical protein